MMIVVQARRILDQTLSMAEFSGMRKLKHGFTMNCEVVYSAL